MSTEYRIGEFAYEGGVSAKALRFYDQIGLLRPARIDPQTRYRFYLPEQLKELAAIVELRDAGASLAEIRRLKKRDGFTSGWRHILRDLKTETERSLEAATHSLRWINCLLEESEAGSLPIPVVVKQRQAIAIASVRSKVASYDEIGRLEKELLRSLPRPAVGEYHGVLWHSCAGSGVLEGEAFVALNQRVPARGGLRFGSIACGDPGLRVFHFG